MVLQLYFSCNLHGMRYNVDCHASRLCGRLQTAHTLQNVPDYYNKEEELHMNQFTKAVKSLAAKYNETSLILRIAIGLLIGAALALICPGAVWLEEFGSLFVGALKGIAPVLVFVIVASALAQGSSKLDRRFGTVVWLYTNHFGFFGDYLWFTIQAFSVAKYLSIGKREFSLPKPHSFTACYVLRNRLTFRLCKGAQHRQNHFGVHC